MKSWKEVESAKYDGFVCYPDWDYGLLEGQNEYFKLDAEWDGLAIRHVGICGFQRAKAKKIGRDVNAERRWMRLIEQD